MRTLIYFLIKQFPSYRLNLILLTGVNITSALKLTFSIKSSMKKCPKREECESRHKRWLIIERLDNFRLYLDTGAPWLIIPVVRGFPVSDLYCGYTDLYFPRRHKKNIKTCIRGLPASDLTYFHPKSNDKNKNLHQTTLSQFSPWCKSSPSRKSTSSWQTAELTDPITVCTPVVCGITICSLLNHCM